MFCKICGNQIVVGGKFCSKCGAPFKADSLPPVASSQSDRHISNPPKGRQHFSLPGIPSVKDKTVNFKDEKILAELAKHAGYVFYSKSMSRTPDKKRNTTAIVVSAVSMFLVFCTLMGGQFMTYYNLFTGFRATKGLFSDTNYGYSAMFPGSWKISKNPRRMLNVDNAIGYFIKGDLLKPDIQAMVYDAGLVRGVPEQIPPELLDIIEPEVSQRSAFFARQLGMSYEYLGMNLVDINERDGIFIEGNIWQKGSPKKRDFTFYAFGQDEAYYIKFVFNEEYVENYWPEIKEIISSMRFR